MSSRSLNESAKYDLLAEQPGAFANMWETPPWVISCIVHVAVLFILYQITMTTFSDEEQVIDSSIVEEEINPEDFKFDPTIQDQMGADSQLNVLSPSKAAATEAGRDPQKDVVREVENELLAVQKPVTDQIPQPNQAEFVESVDTTGATEYTGGVEGAIDRLTYEIADSLRDNKTLVVWLFDASLSLKERREAIANRFENVYAQLGQLDVTTERALKTAVASYGNSTHLITPDPVDDVKDIVKAVHDIKPDETGKENVFQAVYTVTNKWKSYRTAMHRNMMIVIVTDERGDDYGKTGENMEQVIREVRRLGIRVYCVGNAAPFGREKGYVNWRYPDGATEKLPVDSGPETVAPERLRLGFWGTNGGDLENMSAGMGPWALTRLCAETNGLYLVSEESVDGPKFDPQIMREYAPDYRPIKFYEQQLASNKAKRALVNTAVNTHQTNTISPQLRFSAPNDNVLRQEITEAQKPAAVYDYRLNQMQMMLEEGENDREKLTTPRWRASYDLAMGRVLALRTRAYGYNIVLAEMKSTPKTFQNKDSNAWRLVPSKEITGGPQVRKIAKKAEEYLTRVIDEHQGTPWAMLAERELGTPMGWEWQEYRDASASGMNGNGNNNPNLLQLAEEEKKKQMQKKMAEKKRVKPNL